MRPMTDHLTEAREWADEPHDQGRPMGDFSPCPDSTGLNLFELWESLAPGDGHFLVAVAGSPADLKLKPGDVIVRRRWAPASRPAIHSEARRETDR